MRVQTIEHRVSRTWSKFAASTSRAWMSGSWSSETSTLVPMFSNRATSSDMGEIMAFTMPSMPGTKEMSWVF